MIILYIILGLLTLAIFTMFIFGKEIVKKSIESILSDDRERNKDILDEKLKQGTQKLEDEKDAIKELVQRIETELKNNQKNLSDVEIKRVSQFSAIKTALDDYKTITTELKGSTDDLKNILSNDRLRGKYGQEVAENLLRSVGFVKDQHYVIDKALDTTTTRPDITVFLPDKTKINVDAKFPWQALVRYQETDDKLEKAKYLKEFERALKVKITEVTSRDYINIEEPTVDFVIMFVPNEMIFSFIYEKMNDIWNDAFEKKVIMAGPFSFTAILRMVFQAHKNFKYQENLQGIIKHIKTFEIEYEKFNEALDKLGDKIRSTDEQYQAVSLTRTKKLTGIVDKIKAENVLPSQRDSSLTLDKPSVE
ncbi:MAG: DNA recombination protein RmuC [bacterium]|nr:DNA recombination protein RmuC [bacterium]